MSAPPDPSQAGLDRWDGEGGAESDGPQALAPEREGAVPAAPSAQDWAELRTRVIALENLVIALLANGSDAQRALARTMAGYIAPRPGATPHRVTLHASHRMIDLVERAERFDAADLEDAPAAGN
jgi:hypothetical protein